MKHSASHYVSVHLGCNAEELILTIADDGVGFDVNAVEGKGIGLISIRERLEMLGGTLDHPIEGWAAALVWRSACRFVLAQAIEGQPMSGAGRVA